MLPERQNLDGGGKEAWPEETSQDTASVDYSDFGSLRKREKAHGCCLQTLEGLEGVRLSVPPQTKALPDNYVSIQYKRGENCLGKKVS